MAFVFKVFDGHFKKDDDLTMVILPVKQWHDFVKVLRLGARSEPIFQSR